MKPIDGSVSLSLERIAELGAAEEFILTVSSEGFGKRTSAYDYRRTGRGGQGLIAQDLSKRGGRLVASFPVEEADQMLLVTDQGQLIRVRVAQIRIAGRNTQGVTIFRTAQDEHVVSVERVEGSDDDDDIGDIEGGEAGRSGAGQFLVQAESWRRGRWTRIGLYPGTFDPVTNGHLDIIGRAVKLVDRLIIGVAVNPAKSPLFSLEERVEIIREETLECAKIAEVEVRTYDNLTIHFAREVGAQIVIRGLRAVADFEYEFRMTAMNQQLDRDIETVFLMADPRHQALASSLVKDIVSMGGDVSPLCAAGGGAAPGRQVREGVAGLLSRRRVSR